MSRAIANVIGLDDAPFERGDATAPLVGTVYARDRLDGAWSARSPPTATTRPTRS
ncbi:MAG: hypothetical protein R3B99_03725 [Polyangiales bacterium]